MYGLHKVSAGRGGVTYRLKDAYPTLSAALAAAPRFGWGIYVVCAADGRRAAHVRVAPPPPPDDEPVESALAAQVPAA
jgi:hypothetical protein